MVLNHVANRARLIVEGASALDPEVLRHGDLDALDLVAIPERLQQGIDETKEYHVMHWPLPKVMVDAENGRLVESGQQDPIELPRRRQVMSEGFFDDYACVLGRARFGELLHNQLEQHGRNGEVVGRPLSRSKFFPDGLKSGGVFVVAVNIAQQAAQLV